MEQPEVWIQIVLFREKIWSDLAQYRRTQEGLLKRKLTKEEKETFALLPNVELKKMYIQKILTPIRKIKKSVVNRAIAVVITRR